MPTYDQLDTLTEFFEEYGTVLAEKAEHKLKPLHIPGTDPILFDWNRKFPKGEFLRKPYEPQAHVITASVKSLNHQHMVWIIGEPGTGKTLMGMCAAHVHAREKPYRGLVVCPDHLLDKWQREIEETIPKAIVTRVRHWSHMLDLVPETIPYKFNLWPEAEGPEWTLIGRDKCKLGPSWRPAAWTQARSLTDARQYALRCPDCGAKFQDKDGNMLSWEAMPKNRKKLRCRQPRMYLTGVGDEPPKEEVRECGGVLWTYVKKPYYRWAPERVINCKLRGYYDYLILDEMHEYKSATSAQANAAGAIAAVAKNTIAMTGTLIGGRADHLFPLTYRLCPKTLVEEGFNWDDTMDFVRKYGKIQTTIRIKKDKDKNNSTSNKNSRGSSEKPIEKPAPGILPALYGRHVMGHTVFLGLSEMAPSMVKLDEGVLAVEMDDDLKEAMEEINEELVPIACEMAACGNMKLLGMMLEVLLYYPDHPYDWPEIGYHDPETEEYIPVMTPRSLSRNVIRPKEAMWLKFVAHHRKKGNQVWSYIQRNGDRDVMARLEWLAQSEGLKVTTLRSSVDREKREAWIAAQGKGVDVMISHPQLVETGLDLFGKRKGGHNYNAMAFYQTGYRPFTMMQASRRGWRLSQWKRCFNRYLYYVGTAQEGALSLMGHKLKATLALQGQYSEDGLAAMTGDQADAMQMAKQLTAKLGDTGRVWETVTSLMGSNVAEDDDELAHDDNDDELSTGVVITPAMRAQFMRGKAAPLMFQPAASFNVTERMNDLRRKLKR